MERTLRKMGRKTHAKFTHCVVPRFVFGARTVIQLILTTFPFHGENQWVIIFIQFFHHWLKATRKKTFWFLR